MLDRNQLSELKDLSGRLGRDPLLVQAASGNTSLKANGTLWIKASGKWLANAGTDEIFVPVEREEIGTCLQRDVPYTPAFTGTALTPSIETAMHAVLPQRVVIHVHSVNVISWAVREDGPAELAARLDGLAWKWIPYVASGFPLARAIQRTLHPAPDVLVLANHGLVVCGNDCHAAEGLLREVERRLNVEPRTAPAPNLAQLENLARGSGWCVPDAAEVHALATDATSRAIVAAGTLYPCHGLFLGPGAAEFGYAGSPAEASANYRNRYGVCPTTLVVDGEGVLVTEQMTAARTEVLIGLSQVVQRIHAGARVRYLSDFELGELLNTDAYQYLQHVEESCYPYC
ncbi:MAG: class aldolase/adducin family protein [Bryobacterales bacterium]|nr:class aldolase/adducin family protein [Bryobacterales bacterium]